MRVRVLNRFALGPGRVANPGEIHTFDERKEAALIGAIRNNVEILPPEQKSAGPQPDHEVTNRDPNVRNRVPRPNSRRGA